MSLAAGKAVSDEVVDPRIKGLADLAAKAALGQGRRVAHEELMIEPGCAVCRDLRLDGQVRSHGEHHPRGVSPLAFQIANLDNAAHGRRMLDRLEVRKSHVV